MKQIAYGVPRGSILGPVLSSASFVNDAMLFYRSNNLQELSATVNNGSSNIMQWSNANRLSLNIDKTNFMIFRPRGKNEVCPTIHICGAEIQEVDSANFWGIMIDDELNWMEHIKCISRKMAKGIGIILKARKSFESETLLNLYNALICPHISCGIQVWGTAASIHLHRLYVLQKKTVRIICGVHPRTHTEPLYESLIILNIDQIRDYSIALFLYKLTKHLLPPLFEDMLVKTSDVHNHSTRQADLLHVQHSATKRTQKTLKHYGINLCNSLYHVFLDRAISTFTCNLKYFLLSWFFNTLFTILFSPNVVCKIAVEMNLGHIRITSLPIVKVGIPLLLFILFAL